MRKMAFYYTTVCTNEDRKVEEVFRKTAYNTKFMIKKKKTTSIAYKSKEKRTATI